MRAAGALTARGSRTGSDDRIGDPARRIRHKRYSRPMTAGELLREARRRHGVTQPLLETLGEAEVDFVVIGGLAGGAHGSSYPTYDLDITYARTRENVERLSTALRRLGSPTNAPTIDTAARLTLTTKHGPLDLVADPAGAPTYAVLKANAVRATVSGHEVRLASLDHL